MAESYRLCINIDLISLRFSERKKVWKSSDNDDLRLYTLYYIYRKDIDAEWYDFFEQKLKSPFSIVAMAKGES